jgi:hypothetical protein
MCHVDEDIQTIIPQDADVIITLNRTPCFGNCPSYDLEIRDNGLVVYDGGNDVKQSGQHTDQISQADFHQLTSAFEELNYYLLEQKYRRAANIICDIEEYNYMTDFPYVHTSLTVNGQRTEIDHYHGLFSSPDELSQLENLIDEVANSSQWVR